MNTYTGIKTLLKAKNNHNSPHLRKKVHLLASMRLLISKFTHAHYDHIHQLMLVK